jgi:biotin transport system substrate-specific component
VLLVGCLGGRNAAVLSQVAYLALGLLWFDTFGLQIFDQGGGLGYVREPAFGYLLGFIPAAGVCGYLAFQSRPRLETLALSCLVGLVAIHITGLLYLSVASLIGWVDTSLLSYGQAVLAYSVYRIPGHLAIACIVTVLAYSLRRLMFY